MSSVRYPNEGSKEEVLGQRYKFTSYQDVDVI